MKVRNISVLLDVEKQGGKMSKEEKEYLKRYKQNKNFRHSRSFVTHAKDLPEESEIKIYRE